MTTPKIFVRNLQRKVKVDARALQRFAERAAASCTRHNGPGERVLTLLPEVQVVLVSDRKIAELHQRFMDIAGPTDVITFQHGEIVISVETAVRHAAEYGQQLPRELQLYIVHGLLHLAGFDDSTAASRRRMHRLQESILEQLIEG